jgi:hypothetical protein
MNEPNQNPQTPQLSAPAPKPVLTETPAETMPAPQVGLMNDRDFLAAAFLNVLGPMVAKGGDTRFAVQTALQAAREALGAAIACGIVAETSLMPNGQPLWQTPAVPQPAGAQRQNVTLG